MVLTDGPFIDSKEYLAGLLLVEADDLDQAVALAGQLLQDTRQGVGIEVRPSSTGSPVALDAVFREQWGRVLATLVGVFGDNRTGRGRGRRGVRSRRLSMASRR